MCELHFQECDVIKEDVFICKDGTTSRIPRIRYSLQTNAIPYTAFKSPNNSEESSAIVNICITNNSFQYLCRIKDLA